MKRLNPCWSAAMGLILVAGFWAAVGTPQTRAQSSSAPKKLTGPQTKNPKAWPYADAYDEINADGEAYHIRYEDAHIRLVEVAIFPGLRTNMHGDPYPAITAMDAPLPKVTDVKLEPDSKLNGQGAGHAPPPQGLTYPVGMSEAPRAPHAVTNTDTFPSHHFKVEYKRIDGDDFKTHWKEWYPWILQPIKTLPNIDPKDPKLGPPVSKVYPFSAKTESYIAAPNNHYVRYQDDHVVFLEVTFRQGERENLHGHAYPSVFSRDIGVPPTASGPTLAPNPKPPQPETNIPGIGHAGKGGNWELDPSGINGQGGGTCAPPAGMQYPNCATMGPQWPHAASNLNEWPSHFYRIQFKRVDGEGLKTHWREWYPWMAKAADDYKKAHPTAGN